MENLRGVKIVNQDSLMVENSHLYIKAKDENYCELTILDENGKKRKALGFAEPKMTDGYYGMWNVANKTFLDGGLKVKEVNWKQALQYKVSDSSLSADILQIGSLTSNGIPTEGASLSLGKIGYNLFRSVAIFETSNPYEEMYNEIQAGHNHRAESRIQSTYRNSSNDTIKQVYVTTRVYNDLSRTTELRLRTDDNIVISKGELELLAYYNTNDYWKFYKPIKVKDSLSFDLPTANTPTPNTLMPKTDGSGLMWYDNNGNPHEVVLNQI